MTRILFVLISVAILWGNGFAQGEASLEKPELYRGMALFVGASFPFGHFAATKDEDESGFALRGVLFGGEYVREAVHHIDLSVTALLSINQVDEVAFAELMRSRFMTQNARVTVSVESWKSIWVMIGLGFRVNVTDRAAFFLHGHVGVAFAIIPSIDAKVVMGGNSASFKQEATGGLDYAYGVSSGFAVGPIEIAARLFSSQPEFTSSQPKLKQSMSVVHISVGILF
ncbi:MAG: hypothetical protein HY961_07940 [Ignavibacteriae bacterium]|nr:hypothetical protein [Ignavibacteriota bacterium]